MYVKIYVNLYVLFYVNSSLLSTKNTLIGVFLVSVLRVVDDVRTLLLQGKSAFSYSFASL